jgi:hypothetical protein
MLIKSKRFKTAAKFLPKTELDPFAFPKLVIGLKLFSIENYLAVNGKNEVHRVIELINGDLEGLSVLVRLLIKQGRDDR